MGGMVSSKSSRRREMQREQEAEQLRKQAQLLEQPFRKNLKKWNKEYSDELVHYTKTFEIHADGDLKPHILLLGPAGSGKSSFINSILSISSGKYVNKAFCAGKAFGNVTGKLNTYCGDIGLDNIMFSDTAGLMEVKGFNLKNMEKLLDGRVMEGYTFHPAHGIDKTDKYYREDRTVQHMVHCICFVVASTILKTVDESYKIQIKKIQDDLNANRVQRVLILTKCDLLCHHVKANPANIFKSRKVEEAVKKAGDIFAIPAANIHPVVNYGEGDPELDSVQNIPLLLALKQMIHFSKDFVDLHMEDIEKEEESGRKNTIQDE